MVLMKIAFYNVDLGYIDFLKKYEYKERGFTRVPNVQYRSGNNKFFYGTVLNISGIDYFVPISSKTHNRQDDILIKSKDKCKSEDGTLRFAYMLPVPHQCLSMLDISKISDYTRKERVRKELAFCRKNKDKIEKQAQLTYYRILSGKHIGLNQNSCEFKVLEEAYIQYCIDKNIDLPKEIVNKESDRLSEQKMNCPSKTTFPLSRDMIKKNAKAISSKHSEHQPALKNKKHNNNLS